MASPSRLHVGRHLSISIPTYFVTPSQRSPVARMVYQLHSVHVDW